MDSPIASLAIPDGAPSLRRAAEVAVTALSGVEAVASVWVTGSLARGTADRYSDLDLIAIARPGSEFPRGPVVGALESALTPVLVLERDFGASVLFSLVTPQWIRVDIDLFRADAPLWRRADTVVTVFDRGPDRPAWASADEPPAPADVVGPVQEIVRVLGLLPAVLGRGSTATGLAGCGLLTGHLIALATALAGGPATGRGALAREAAVPAAYRTVLDDLPAAGSNAEQILAFHLAAWDAAGRLLALGGHPFPADLSAASAALALLYRREFGAVLARPGVRLEE